MPDLKSAPVFGAVCCTFGIMMGLVWGYLMFSPSQLQQNVWSHYQYMRELDLKNVKPSEPDTHYFKDANVKRLIIRDEKGDEKVVIDQHGVRVYGTGVGKEVGAALFANSLTIRNPRMGGVNAELSVDEKTGGKLILSDRDGDNQNIVRSGK